MGFVIWFQARIEKAAFGGLLPLRVSNDVFGGEYVLDAEIRIDLVSGAAASTFSITFTSLPADVVETLRSRHAAALAGGKPLSVVLSLGYFDDPDGRSAPVVRGVVTSIRTRVSESGELLTDLRGMEAAGFQLLRTAIRASHADGPLTAAVKAIAKAASGAGDALAVAAAGLPEAECFTLRAGDGLEALRQVADFAKAPLVIGDGTIRVGTAVGTGTPLRFTATDNIVTLTHVQEDPEDLVPRPPDTGADDPLGAAAGAVAALAGVGPAGKADAARTSVELTVLGDPAIRPGLPAVLEPADGRDAPPGTLRVERAVHVFGRHGYTCDVTLVVAEPGRRAVRTSGADGLARRFRDLAESVRTEHPAIDVGEVARYRDGRTGGHLADLRYGQSPAADVVAPSVETEVDREPLLRARPMASPFAFHNCGLMVPVLPGMRAVLAHNRGLVNDAVVTGFLWPEKPASTPPKNRPGDWWLCLPTGLDATGLPTGKGVNDLTDARGRRVVQVKGLRVAIGDRLLPEVGERPTVPDDLDGRLVIEHASGTTVTVAPDGGVTIDAGAGTITLRGGTASLTLGDGKIKLSGAPVEVA
ncbi:hypothetical protein LO762_08345 [Actinocorallia sp. API 0066]|uniref:hypothetical protein n=1 Tax=Actinocorallia sp. API 0066 TaxID=2896846 RepID=UPI001E58BDC5|nr:hypothetical protein [Actinocorallia sp. API 0066]MCD0449196.1 hypothetical protein [Actinocorallia sp. API 0066]